MSQAESPFGKESPELTQALDEGERAELPDNVAPGILTEWPVDIHKTESYEYAGNAGLSQEETAPVRWMLILALYLLVITGPVAIWLLWRDRAWRTWQKWVITALMLAGYAAMAWRVLG
jgi:hypothetical protein